jgi:hypothetical protein
MNLCDPMNVPPGGWRYLQPESGMEIRGGSWQGLMQKVLVHRKANSYPIGTHIEAEVAHALCLRLPAAQQAEFCCEPQLPPLLNQAMSFEKSAGAVVAGLAQGRGLAAAEEMLQNRMSICHSCEFLNRPLDKCSKCGCSVSRKAWVRASSCPVGKW